MIWIACCGLERLVGAMVFSEPAGSATIPNVTSADELLPANALSSATWSAMLAIGASVGGVVTAVAGRNVAFVVNAASFFASAFFIARTHYDSTPPAMPRPTGLLALTGISDLIEGLRYVRQRSHVAALMLVKAGWGLAGGVLLLLTIFGERVFPIGSDAAGGIRGLVGARGGRAAPRALTPPWDFRQPPRNPRSPVRAAVLLVCGL